MLNRQAPSTLQISPQTFPQIPPAQNLAVSAAAGPTAAAGSSQAAEGAGPQSTPAAAQAQWSALAQAVLQAGGSADARAVAISAALVQAGVEGLLAQIFNNQSPAGATRAIPERLTGNWLIQPPGAEATGGTTHPDAPPRASVLLAAQTPLAIARTILAALGLPLPGQATAEGTTAALPIETPEIMPEIRPGTVLSAPAAESAGAAIKTALRDLVARTLSGLTQTAGIAGSNVDDAPKTAGLPILLGVTDVKPSIPQGGIAKAGVAAPAAGAPANGSDGAAARGALPSEIDRAVTMLLEAFRSPAAREVALGVLQSGILQGTPALLSRILYGTGPQPANAMSADITEPPPATQGAIAAGTTPKAPSTDGDHTGPASLFAQQIKTLVATLQPFLTLAAGGQVTLPAGTQATIAPNPAQLQALTAQGPQSSVTALENLLQGTKGIPAEWTTRGVALEVRLPAGTPAEETIQTLRDHGMQAEVTRKPGETGMTLRVVIPGSEAGATPVELSGLAKGQDPAAGDDPARPQAEARGATEQGGAPRDPAPAPESAAQAAQRAETILRGEQAAERAAQSDGRREGQDAGSGRNEARPEAQTDARFAQGVMRPPPHMAPFVAAAPWNIEDRGRARNSAHETSGTPHKEAKPIFTYDDDYVHAWWSEPEPRPAVESLRFAADGSDLEAIPV